MFQLILFSYIYIFHVVLNIYLLTESVAAFNSDTVPELSALYRVRLSTALPARTSWKDTRLC